MLSDSPEKPKAKKPKPPKPRCKNCGDETTFTKTVQAGRESAGWVSNVCHRDPGVRVPDVSIDHPFAEPKLRLYAMCGWGYHAAVYDEAADLWLGFWQCPHDTTITKLIAEGKVLKATKPYHQW